MVSVAVYAALAVIGWGVLGARSGIAWVIAMSALVLVVGVSRLFLDVRYPIDVLASWAGGLLWLDVSLVLAGMLACSGVEAREDGENLRPSEVAQECAGFNVSEPAERRGRQEHAKWDPEQTAADDGHEPKSRHQPQEHDRPPTA